MQATDWISFKNGSPANESAVVCCNAGTTEFWSGIWVIESEDRRASEAFGEQRGCIMKTQYQHEPAPPHLLCRGKIVVGEMLLTHWTPLVKP